jgi:dTDP-alpha-D-glucose dehydrogenase
MPDALHLNPEEIDTVEKRGKHTVSVIGCGQKGINYGLAFAEAGFKVVCTDADQSVVRRLSRGKLALPDREMESKLKRSTRTGMLSFTNETKSAVAQSDIIMLTIATKIDEKKNADYSEIQSSCKEVGAALRRGVLVIYGGVASFGLMEGVVKEMLENTSGLKVGEDFGLAYNPAAILDEDRSTESFSNKELVVAANDKNSLNSAAIVLATLTRKGVRQISDFETAELAALFAVARRDANVALSNEFAMLCENAGKDYFETLRIADMGFFEMDYAPTVAEESWRDELYLLLESAENLNAKLRLTTVARQLNESMARYAVGLLQDTLRSCGKTLRRARVTLLGTTKPRTSGEDFVRMLEAKGAKISLYDPLLSRDDFSDTGPASKRNLSEAVEGSDCIVILTADSQFKHLNLKNLRAVVKAPAAIVDLVGIIKPEDVDKEGFIYRGLGRGSEKK